MGQVYRAENLDVGRQVAIKVLHLEHALNAQVVERFLREARAANLVRHPNVVDVLDIGREADGTPFIVQELLDGEDLAHFVERRGGKLPLHEVIEILGPVIDAVGEAHARGVIHRDIKPDNVFLAKGRLASVPKLLDFGISKVSIPDQLVTEAGVMMGTPAYMPPEQVEGARTADPRSDVWALGVMLFELITGRMPFEAPTAPALFYAIATEDAPTLLEVGAQVPPEISQLVARCLRRLPDDRYPSAAELARDLRHIAAGTDLEPTSKRSIRSAASKGLIPPLVTPAGEHAPTFTSELVLPPAAVIVPRIAPPPTFEAPRTVASLSAAVTPPEPAPAAAPTPTPRGLPRNDDLGQMHAVTSTRPRPTPPRWTPEAMPTAAPSPDSRERLSADASGLIGGAVVTIIVIFGVGLLMQLLHRPEGWPVARFVLGSGQTMEVALHGFLALLAVAIGAVNAWRGVRHWKGDLAGGPPNAIFNAVVATVAFFSAVELVSALL
jgi:serine/threonine-protein kinase